MLIIKMKTTHFTDLWICNSPQLPSLTGDGDTEQEAIEDFTNQVKSMADVKEFRNVRFEKE